MTKTNAFVKQFIAKVKGDTTEETAMKVWRQAEASLSTNIPVLEGDIIDAKLKIEKAEENLADARLNGGKEINGRDGRDSYISQLLNAKRGVKLAKKELSDLEEVEEFLKSELKNLKND